MPALNIRMTDSELETLHRRAEAEGVPVTRFVLAAALADADRAAFDAEVTEAGARVIALSRDLLRRLADR